MIISRSHPVPSPARLLLSALLVLTAALPLQAEISPPELEEAAEVARRAAAASLRGQQRVLFEALDIDAILERRIGDGVWAHLTERQREPLRAIVRHVFAAALSSARSVPGEIAWSAARERDRGASIFLGLRFADRFLKTRWALRHAGPGGWRIEDVTLCDPGVSLAARARASLGPHPVRPRDQRLEARQEAYPRLLGLGAIALIVVLSYRRLAPGRRVLLLLTAAAPAVLFLVDGFLAVRRTLAEPYIISENPPAAPWERWVRLARDAEREGDAGKAAPLWEHALGAGAAPAPVAYERGLSARDRADLGAAESEFKTALGAPEPAPGAFRELALLALSHGKSGEAKLLIDRYLDSTGPDPDALSLDAVVETNLGQPQKAVEAIRQARELVGGGTRAAQLEARIHARAADAGGAVAALREIEPTGRLDREALRCDPAYLPIANDPVWVAFLNAEAPSPAVGQTPGGGN